MEKYPKLSSKYVESLSTPAVMSIIFTPFSRISILSQTSTNSTGQVIKNLMQQQSRMYAFYRGFSVSMVNNAIFLESCKRLNSYMNNNFNKLDESSSVKETKDIESNHYSAFTCYPSSSSLVNQRTEEQIEIDMTNKMNHGLKGMGFMILSGIISTTIVHPIDTVRVCMKSDVVQIDGSPAKSSIDVAKSIYNSYGVKGFYRGLIPSLVCTGIGSTLIVTGSVFFVTLDMLVKMNKEENKKDG